LAQVWFHFEQAAVALSTMASGFRGLSVLLRLSAVLLLLPGRLGLSAPISSADGWLNVTLRVEVATVHLNFQNISFRARTYNGSFPGPHLRVSPGDRVRVLLRNALGADLPGAGCRAPLDHLRASNSTNLHVHGIYDDAVQDNTFVCVSPGEDFEYTYKVHKELGTSMLWYHPHLEGSSAMQVCGGMAGFFEIVDEAEEAMFDFAATLPLMIQMLEFNPASKEYIGACLDNGGTSDLPLRFSNPHNFTGRLLLASGEVGTFLALGTGELARLKVVNAMSGTATMLNFGFWGPSASVCTLHVLAYDGIYLHAPRRQRSVLLPPGGKADVAVSCSAPGQHTVGTLTIGAEDVGGLFDTELHPIVSLEVTGPGGRTAKLPDALPGPPPYYADLRQAQVDQRHSILFGNEAGDNIVGGWPYNGSISHVAHRNAVQEWRLYGGEGVGMEKLHPYHQHMVHFQIISRSGGSELMAAVGDYRDTVPLYKDVNYTVRFVVPFTGPMMVHCHILKHQDLGMMTLVNFTDALPPVRLASRPLHLAPLARVLLALCMLSVAAALCACFAGRRSVRDGCCHSNYVRVA